MSKEVAKGSNAISARSTFSGKMGFVLAAAASAVGLGNLWRFPYLAAKYGGSVFLLTYIVLVCTFGFSLMIAEVALGRHTKQSAIGAFKHFGKKFTFIGVLASLVPFIITPYYSVIGGWVVKYMVSYVTTPKAEISADGYFHAAILNNSESYLWMFVFLALVIIIIALGVNKGVERSSKILMPILIALGIFIFIYSLTIPGAMDGLKYYLIPHFEQFTTVGSVVQMLVAAMGQMFFSLSLAMGIMITYGSYFSKSESLERSVRNIEIFDTGIALLAGLIIIPAAFAAMGDASTVSAKSGPSLMFVALPNVFTMMPGGGLVGFLFFMLVLFAALTSAISLFETCVSIVQDYSKKKRSTAIIITAIFMLVVASVVNLGYNNWLSFDPMYSFFGIGEYQDNQLLDFFDFISNTIFMPIVALLTCIFVGWIIKPGVIIEEVEHRGVKFKSKKLFVVMIKYISPVLIVCILVGYILSTAGVIAL